ncbi:MAG: hypothetical protein P0Y59_04445 [Candidatus Sphingomonas phytovorans]|nr:hypothetical protein [Sphingomonas sp.]WEK00950.1 MAG: hypothetical protein P0Y59_04445 [Sphingomonas sp.]
MPLYAGGQISGTQAGARAQVAQARADRDIAVDNAVVQLVQAYYGQQLAGRAHWASAAMCSTGSTATSPTPTKLEQARFISRAQRLQAEVARDDAAREYEKAISDLGTANAALAGMLRVPAGVHPVSPLGVNSRPLEPLDTFKAAALDAHPQLARLKALEDQAQRRGDGPAIEAATHDLWLRPV